MHASIIGLRRSSLAAAVYIGWTFWSYPVSAAPQPKAEAIKFFETRVRPLLAEHCYECHSEDAGEQQGGLLLDRKSGWLSGGDTDKAVIPGEPDSSLLLKAVKYENEDLQMPPEQRLSPGGLALTV